MTTMIDPQDVADHLVDAVAEVSTRVGLFAESSSSMFFLTHALCRCQSDTLPYARISTHWGSMGHAIGGAVGFCAATGRRAAILTGDGSFHLMNPLPAAVKHGLPIMVVVLNDECLGLPKFGSANVGAFGARSTTALPPWDFTRQGSSAIGGRRVSELAALDDAIDEGLSFDGCFMVDVKTDPEVMAPVGSRIKSVAALFGGKA